MNKCLICDNSFNPFVDFGNMPIANAFSTKKELENEYLFSMKVGFCENCNMLIHNAEISWTTIYSNEVPFCPIHKETLIEHG